MSSTITIQENPKLEQLPHKPQVVTSPLISEVLDAIADDKALTMFNTLALSAGKSDILISTLDLTRKQFYSKIDRLVKQGLITRRNGRYYPTTLGKVLYELQNILGIALNNYWKLKAIDSLQNPPGLPESELNQLVDSLLENTVLKNIIVAKVKC
jgi:predicted transcriptional regulator